MPRQRKSVPDVFLLQESVQELDPDLPLLASQAGMLLGRSKTRMDSDRRDGKPPPAYKDGSKVLYRLGDVLAERTRLRERSLEAVAQRR
jgi:hypothetical protein